MYNLLNNFRKKVFKNGEYVLGPFMKTKDPAFVETAGYAGFDFAILDCEHGPVSIENMEDLIRGAQISKMLPIIRVPDRTEASIGKVLDIGAAGIQVPQIKNEEQVKEVIEHARFHPEGERGVCRFVRSARYSATDRYEYFEKANEILLILQLEGQEAIDNIDSILKVEGIDIIFIGPYDLSQSLGVPGETSHSKVIEKMELIVNKAREKDVVVGTFVDEPADIKKWIETGIQYISYSVDVGIFLEACQEIVDFE